MLINDYYTIQARQTTVAGEVFHILLNPDSKVYKGHFPDNPIAPGVCNIQMIKECAEKVVGHLLRIQSIPQCRLTRIITPLQYPQVEVTLQLQKNDDNTYQLHAQIGIAQDIFLILKGCLCSYEA